MNIKERMNEISQAYCTPENEKKEVDTILLLAIKEIAVKICKEAILEAKVEENNKWAEQIRVIPGTKGVDVTELKEADFLFRNKVLLDIG